MAAKSTQEVFTPEAVKDQDNLNQNIKKQIVQSKPVNVCAGLGPYFYKLPRELRDQIFSYLLVSGYPGLMRTSRAMEQEGKTWIAKTGIFRVNVGSCNGINYNPSPETVDRIQNVNIAIKNTITPYSSLDQHPELKILDLFAGSTPHRKTCNVSIEFYATGPTLVSDKVLVRLQCLTGFEKVILRIGIKWTSVTNLIKPSDSCLDTSHELKSWYSDFEMTGKCLQQYLGKTGIKSDKDGWCMVFYPRKAAEEGTIILEW